MFGYHKLKGAKWSGARWDGAEWDETEWSGEERMSYSIIWKFYNGKK